MLVLIRSCSYYKSWFLASWQLIFLNLSRWRDVCARLRLTTGVSLNWRPPYGEKHTDRKHTEARTHTQTHKRRLRIKCRPKSGVGEWSRFRWKSFFWHHWCCWASAGSYRQGLCQRGRCWGPATWYGRKSLKSKRRGREKDKKVTRQ